MKSVAQEQGITPAQAEQDFLKTMRPTSLIQRFATTEEVANMVVYSRYWIDLYWGLAPEGLKTDI